MFKLFGRFVLNATLLVSGALLISSAQAQDRVTPGAPTPLAAGDPLMILYAISGIRDNGAAANLGVATTFHCSNLSNVTERINIVVRNFDGTVKANLSFDIAERKTKTASTHATVLYSEDETLLTGAVNQGLALIRGSNTNIFCTAMTIDAAAAVPQGIHLHGTRYNPHPGTQG